MADGKGKSKGKKKGPASTATLSELIAAKSYPEAIEVLRSQLSQRPGIQTRLQLADLLLLSGRRDEAMPIFMSLADELTTDGFVAKALAILKRVDRLEPGRADVEARFSQLAKQPQRSPAPPVIPAPPARPPAPAFGIEEVGAAEPPPAAPALPTAEPVAAAAPPTPEETPVVTEAALEAPSISATPEAEFAEAPPAPEAAAEGADATTTASATATAEAAPTTPERKREGSGIGGIWKRLMTALAPTVDLPAGAANPDLPGEGAPASSEATPPPEDVAPPEAETPSETRSEPEPSPVPVEEEIVIAADAPTSPVESSSEAAITVEPIVESEVDAPPAEQPPPEPTAPVETPIEPVVTETPAVVTKLGGVFKRFLANLPGGQPDAPEATEKDLEAALTAAGIDPETAKEDEEAFFDTFIDDEDLPPAAEDAIAPPPSDPTLAAIALPRWSAPMNEAGFRDQVLDLIEEALKRPPEVTPAAPGETTEPIANAYRDELLAHPLFRDLSEHEMLAMLRALRLACYDPGEIIVTEGEPGAGLFLLISGVVKVFARNPSGHNLPVSVLTEGSFFGEMSLLSGKPRNATVIAAEAVELLELPKPLLDAIAVSHPRVRDIVDALYLQRASSPEMAAVRNVAIGNAQTRERAMQVLKAYFGGRRWEPRMQLKLAMVLLKAGKEDEAVPVLVDLAETLLRERDPAKAIAILKKVEAIRKRSQQVVNLAPLHDEEARHASSAAPALTAPRRPAWAGQTEAFFSDWLGTFRRSVAAEAGTAAPKPIPGYGPELVASPLFEGFTEEELLAFIQALRLSVFEPGEIIITEGEPGQSVFILTVGSVRVFVRNPTGHDIQLCQLKEGAFFGEMSALSGRPRTATVTAASRCELLELERATLDSIANTHPRIRQVLEEVYIERAGSAAAERIRTAAAPPA